MSQQLRSYQDRAIAQPNGVRWQWANGARRVLLVSPTGSGKTRMGEAGTEGFHHVLWLAHRKELIKDASERLAQSLGGLEVGVVAAGVRGSPYSRVQVSSVQTLLRRNEDTWPAAELVVVDEAHHYAAEEWKRLVHGYPEARFLYLTATPERPDGKPLTGIADVMVVAAKHSELLAGGFLCPSRIFAPEKAPGEGLAMDPALAWERYSEGSPGFAFFGSVDMAYQCEHNMNERGIRAAVIEQSTDKGKRAEFIEQLRNGELDCICNVYTMTEGVDVPRARVCMLASPVNHAGQYLQKTGRVLRTHESKTDCIIIDLVSAWELHGTPIDDREYSFDGKAIKRSETVSLRNCPKCGAVNPSITPDCIRCGYMFPVGAGRPRPAGPVIHDMALREVFAGKDTPSGAKRAEYLRLRKLQQLNGYDLYFVIKSYRELFGEPCIISDATLEEKRAFYGKMMRKAKAQGAKHKYASVQFKNTFGHWPPKAKQPSP